VRDQKFVWLAKKPPLAGADDNRYSGENQLWWHRSDDFGGKEGCLIDSIDIGAGLMLNAF
jgi:hypothetical protein